MRSSSESTSDPSTAVISVGFPGTVASLRQQWGRAGRRGHGLAVLVASEDALDQFFMREPETLLGRRVEAAILDHETAGSSTGSRAPRSRRRSTRPTPRSSGPKPSRRPPSIPSWRRRRPATSGRAATYPAGRFGLRSTSPDVFTMVTTDTGSVLGTIERDRAYSTVHEGAIHLHLGESDGSSPSTSPRGERSARWRSSAYDAVALAQVEVDRAFVNRGVRAVSFDRAEHRARVGRDHVKTSGLVER